MVKLHLIGSQCNSVLQAYLILGVFFFGFVSGLPKTLQRWLASDLAAQ